MSFLRTKCVAFSSGIGGGRFVSLYESLVGEGKIRPDPRQKALVNLMQSLGDTLELNTPSSRPEPTRQTGWFNFQGWKAAGHESRVSTPLRKGLYIYGGCGTGKTMLMDIFFTSVKFSPKKRVHFHEYMIDVHSRLFAMQKKCQSTKPLHASSSNSEGDLVERVASDLMKEATLLCFDEFQVTHISDAVLMRRLFSIMFARGVVVLATSNRPPDDLYLNGLNRELFAPFIPVLKQYCIVHNMDSDIDYRQMSNARGELWKTYFSPLNTETSKALESRFFRLAKNEIDFDTSTLEVQGRTISIRRAAKHSSIAWFAFNELCDKPLGSADYISIAKRFHTVFIEGIPPLSLQELNQTRRLITLIDALYDNGTRIFFSAESTSLAGIFNLDEQTKKSSSIDEVFAWDRTVSRLTEMTSVEYLIKHSRKLAPQEFFGQYDLDAKSFSVNELREIFARYDKNNDSIIVIAGLNRMINDIHFCMSGGGTREALFARPALLEKLSVPSNGTRIHFDGFRDFIEKNGILALVQDIQ